MIQTPITLTPQTRQHLGRQLATLYDVLPLPPVGPRLAAALLRLDQPRVGTSSKPGR